MDIINKEKILEHAKKLVSEGKFDRAIVEYQHLLQLDPDDLRIKIKIAELHVKRKQVQEAIKMYKEVAGGYADGGFYLKAVTVYKSILRLNPSLIDVNLSLSELYEKMGLIQDALYQYQIVASAMDQKDDQSGVLGIREKMVSIDPNNIPMRVRLAETYQLQGMPEKALDMYEELARQIKEKGDNAQLIELYTKILAHRPEKHDLVRELCHMYFKRGEWKEILKRMDIAKDFVANDSELLAMQADIYTRLNQIETAKGKYKELAELYIDENRPEDALQAYENILYLGPEDEAEIKDAVEEVREGAFEDVKTRVEERRKKMAEEEKKREQEAVLQREMESRSEEPGKRPRARPDEPSIGQVEATKLEKDAASSYDLGVMYKKMGLAEEGKAEFSKALKIYQRLAAIGRITGPLSKRLSELETLFGEKEPMPTRPAVKETAKREPPKKEPSPKPKEREQKKDAEPKDVSSKKKISFV